jgi:DeoR/GlpR family transcriptional regulator of sugar metabolism
LLLGLSYLIAILFPHRLEQRLQQAMHYVGEHGVITCTVYCELTGVSEEVARHDLEELVKRGVLRATGNPQGGYYRFL